MLYVLMRKVTRNETLKSVYAGGDYGDCVFQFGFYVCCKLNREAYFQVWYHVLRLQVFSGISGLVSSERALLQESIIYVKKEMPFSFLKRA